MLKKLSINAIFHFMIHTKLRVKGQIHFFELVFTGKIHDNIRNTCTTKHVADKKIDKKVVTRHNIQYLSKCLYPVNFCPMKVRRIPLSHIVFL